MSSTSIYAFAVDVVGVGVEELLARTRAAGLDGVTLAAAYHAARDYLPHHPRSRVHYAAPGTSFRTREERYPPGRVPAPLLPACEGRDVLRELVAEAGRSTIDAWAVYLHDDGAPGRAGAVVNAFGDEHVGTLCAAHPVSREYAIALTADIADTGVRSIAAEVLHYLGFEHGYHHERRFAPLDRWRRFLLSLCFCEACREVAGADALAAAIREAVDGDAPAPDTWSRDAVADSLPGLADHLTEREHAVASLAASCAQTARSGGAEFVFLDVSGGVEGWADGAPSGPLGVDVGWEYGVDVGALDPSMRLLAVPYTSDARRAEREILAYRERFGGAVDVLLRPMWPDVETPAALAEKVGRVRAAGAERVAFYHYGMMPAASMDAIREALA